MLNTDPDLIRIQGFDDQKLKRLKKNFNMLDQKLLFIYLSLGLNVSSYKRSLQLSKETSSIKFLTDPDPDYEYGSGSTDLI
jgi:hypothetical protein